jgi:nucleotide-binding universal stress UspA family protein
MTGTQRFQRILLAIASDHDADITVPVVSDLAGAFASEVRVVHVRERVVAAGGMRERESMQDSIAFAEDVARRFMDQGISASIDVNGARPDRVPDELLAAAQDFEADLIVIGPHHAHGAHQRLFGDVGRSLIHRSPCPVLLMPSTAEQRPDSSST